MSDNPQVKGGALPYLTVYGAVKAAEFYKTAFGAEAVSIHPPDEKGRTTPIGREDRTREAQRLRRISAYRRRLAVTNLQVRHQY